MREEACHVAIIFSDFKGFSGQDDRRYPNVHRLNKYIESSIFTPLSPIIVKTWGDAFAVFYRSCAEAAEGALRLRDYIRTCPWTRWDLEPLPIRIGVHFARVTIMHGDAGVEDIVGKGVNAGARIEPVVEPGKVFCSKLFKDNLMSDTDEQFSAFDLGEMDLAKGFGRMALCELVWKREADENREVATAQRVQNTFFPSIPGKVTDIDRRKFVGHSFAVIKEYFKSGVEESEKLGGGISVSIRKVDEMRFVADLYVNGNLEHQTKIWQGGFTGGMGISCLDGRGLDLHSSNSFNEVLSLEESKGKLFLRSLMSGFGAHGLELDFGLDRMTPEQAAEYLWRRFVRYVG